MGSPMMNGTSADASSSGTLVASSTAAPEAIPQWEPIYKAKDDELANVGCAIRTIACSRDHVITGSSSPVVKVWSVAEAKVDKKRTLQLSVSKSLKREGNEDGATCVEIADNGQLVAVCYDDGQIGLHDLRSPGKPQELEDCPIDATSKAKFVAEQRLVSAGVSGSLFFWDLRTLRLESQIGASPDDPSTSHSKNEEKREVKRLKKEVRGGKNADARGVNSRGRPAPIYSLAVSSDGKLLGCGRNTGLVSVLRLSSYPEWIGSVFTHRHGAVRALAFDARSRVLLSGGEDRHLCMFDAADWHGTAKRDADDAQRPPPSLERFVVHRSWVTSACFCPAASGSELMARLALTSSADGTVKLWELSKSTPVRTYEEHKSSVLCVAWEPSEGRHFFSAGEDSTLRMYARKDVLEDLKAQDAAEGSK
mmetsp:Transcript_118024/g.220534  ORF Transcript_118024/g.220534 Transcript_118024/m.220534 type:complete len:422 (-) Transcript_118024:150-1415(-)